MASIDSPLPCLCSHVFFLFSPLFSLLSCCLTLSGINPHYLTHICYLIPATSPKLSKSFLLPRAYQTQSLCFNSYLITSLYFTSISTTSPMFSTTSYLPHPNYQHHFYYLTLRNNNPCISLLFFLIHIASPCILDIYNTSQYVFHNFYYLALFVCTISITSRESFVAFQLYSTQSMFTFPLQW